MLQPGLSRAVPMGILGFIGGALLALVISMLQGLDPAGSVGAALVLGAFISAGVFSFNSIVKYEMHLLPSTT